MTEIIIRFGLAFIVGLVAILGFYAAYFWWLASRDKETPDEKAAREWGDKHWGKK